MEILILMGLFALGLFINFSAIHTLGSWATGDWSEWKQAMLFILVISVVSALFMGLA